MDLGPRDDRAVSIWARRAVQAIGGVLAAIATIAAMVVVVLGVVPRDGMPDAVLPWAIVTVLVACVVGVFLVRRWAVRRRPSQHLGAGGDVLGHAGDRDAVGDVSQAARRAVRAAPGGDGGLLLASGLGEGGGGPGSLQLLGIVESIPDAVIVAERDESTGELHVAYVNRGAIELLATPRSRLFGAPLTSLFRDPAAARTLVRRLEESGSVAGSEQRLVGGNGRSVEARLSASRIDGVDALDALGRDARRAAYVLIASDTSGMRREEARRIATSRLSELALVAESTMELLRGIESVLRGAMDVGAFHAAVVEQPAGPAAGQEPAKLALTYNGDPRTAGVTVHEVTKGLSGYVLEKDAAVILNAEQIRMLVQRGDVKAAEPLAETWASAPMRIGPGLRGVLVIQNHEPGRAFQSADVDLLSFAAEQAAAWFRRRAFEKERKRLSAAVEQAVDALLLLDEQGRVAYVNPAFTRQTGFSREDAAGKSLEELWQPLLGEAPVASIWEIAKAGRPWTGRLDCVRRDGTQFRVEATLSTVLDGDGRVADHVVVQHDVSNEVALEAQFHQAQKMEAVGLLAGGVAHDFNNLLCVILGYGDLVRNACPDDRTKGCVDEILDAARRASTLTGQLLAFSRRQVIEPRPLDLAEVVHDLEKMIRRLIGEQVELVVETASSPDLVEADPHKMDQVLMNLAVNARDAMPQGGTLTIRTEREEFDASRVPQMPGLEPGPHVVLVVSDTGIGMTPEVCKRIFEPFFTTKPTGQGTGLGLSTVYGIVQQAGGHIGVRSEPGKGTEFRIHLPTIARAAAPQRDPSESCNGVNGTETILLVEDEPALRGFAQRVLEQNGYTVLVAESGNRAIELAREFDDDVHLLLSDVVMPHMNGSALATVLVAERPDMAVLFMSGYPDASIANYSVLDPDVDLLQKPFTSVKLLKRVRRALDDRRKRRRRALATFA